MVYAAFLSWDQGPDLRHGADGPQSCAGAASLPQPPGAGPEPISNGTGASRDRKDLLAKALLA